MPPAPDDRAGRLGVGTVAALAVVAALAIRCAADDPAAPPRAASSADVLAGRIPGAATAAQAIQACQRALGATLPPGATFHAPAVAARPGGAYTVVLTVQPGGSTRRCTVSATGQPTADP